MLGEFLLRLAVALPLICGLAALSLYATKRGWLRLPGLMAASTGMAAGTAAAAAPLSVLSVKSLSPAARVAVVRFAGRDLLLGLSGNGLVLLAEAGSAPDSHAAQTADATGPATLREIAS